jgi:hypothetical protein
MRPLSERTTMFKNRALRVTLEPKAKSDTAGRTVEEIINPDFNKLINEHMKTWLVTIGITVVAVAVAIKAADVIGNVIEDKLTY